jgi:glycerophosphoryl diester phosphodiesterase
MAPLIIAHRGGAPHLGENSPDAFAAGLASGADMLEMDVQRAADGSLVVIHDDEIELASGIRRPVKALPLVELRALLPGLLTFDEFLEQFGRYAPTNVDLKGAGFEREIVRALRRHELTGQVIVSSRIASSLRQIRFLAPETSIGLSRGQIVPWLGREPHATIAEHVLRVTLPAQLPAQASYALANSFMLNERLIRPWLVRLLHRQGFRVFCWTVNDEKRAADLIEAGVDGIATDQPSQIIPAIKQRSGT